MAILSFNTNGHIMHYLRCTSFREFHIGNIRSNWIWVGQRKRLENALEGSLNGKLPGKLNALFKLRCQDMVFYLAHISLLQCIRSSMPDGPEGMVRVYILEPTTNYIIQITNIEGIVDLIPIEHNGP